MILSDPLEGGAKEKLRFFREQQIVELKTTKNGQMQVMIYDFTNKLIVFCQSYPQVLFIEVEEDAIYLLVAVA
jgi:hypothetical protein